MQYNTRTITRLCRTFLLNEREMRSSTLCKGMLFEEKSISVVLRSKSDAPYCVHVLSKRLFHSMRLFWRANILSILSLPLYTEPSLRKTFWRWEKLKSCTGQQSSRLWTQSRASMTSLHILFMLTSDRNAVLFILEMCLWSFGALLNYSKTNPTVVCLHNCLCIQYGRYSGVVPGY